MDVIPSVLFMSSSDLNPDDIIKLVLNTTDLPEGVKIDEDIEAYPWHIENKYYTTDVHLCCLRKKSISNKKFAESVQAVILHFDSSTGLDPPESWLPFINEYEAEIKILLCKNCPDEAKEIGCDKRTAQEWCVTKGFELVELEPIIDEDDVEDDFPETTGVKRIVQALNAHVWPNLVMKSETAKPEVQSIRNEYRLEESLEELLDNDDDFSQLFSQLNEMKARVTALSGSDRKAAAEQVVKAFWKAMGGDDEEIDV